MRYNDIRLLWDIEGTIHILHRSLDAILYEDLVGH